MSFFKVLERYIMGLDPFKMTTNKIYILVLLEEWLMRGKRQENHATLSCYGYLSAVESCKNALYFYGWLVV